MLFVIILNLGKPTHHITHVTGLFCRFDQTNVGPLATEREFGKYAHIVTASVMQSLASVGSAVLVMSINTGLFFSSPTSKAMQLVGLESCQSELGKFYVRNIEVD